jgi:uncharacterized protein
MALLLDLTQIRGPREHVHRTYPASAFDARDDEFRVVGDVNLDFDVDKQDTNVKLTGRLEATLEIPCSRCAESMTVPVETTFDLQYVPSSSNQGNPEQEVTEEDLGVAYLEGEVIDLGELVREQFYLTLPMKPLCRSDCAGLCPECGTNLNVARCDCEHRWVDPRMAALQELLPRKSSEH